MDLIFEKVIFNFDYFFVLKEDILFYIEIGWYFYFEYELILIVESYGKCVIGDYVDIFVVGDLLLIGLGILYYMRNDVVFY